MFSNIIMSIETFITIIVLPAIGFVIVKFYNYINDKIKALEKEIFDYKDREEIKDQTILDLKALIKAKNHTIRDKENSETALKLALDIALGHIEKCITKDTLEDIKKSLKK